MASYCFQCNLDMMFGPYSDFEHRSRDQFSVTIELCEGCGPIMVQFGECIDKRCGDHASPSPGDKKRYDAARRYVRARRGLFGPLYYLWDRLSGTPWQPGLIHDWRHRWHMWRELRRPSEPMVFDYGQMIKSEFNPNREIADGEDKATRAIAPSGYDVLPEGSGISGHEDERQV